MTNGRINAARIQEIAFDTNSELLELKSKNNLPLPANRPKIKAVPIVIMNTNEPLPKTGHQYPLT